MPQKSHKTLEYLHLTDSIAKFGFNVIPYSFYKGKGFRYKIIERSSHYAEYTYCGRSYNALGTAITHYILFSPIFSGVFYAYFSFSASFGSGGQSFRAGRGNCRNTTSSYSIGSK
jgi:hypothetical protein